MENFLGEKQEGMNMTRTGSIVIRYTCTASLRNLRWWDVQLQARRMNSVGDSPARVQRLFAVIDELTSTRLRSSLHCRLKN